MKSVPFSKIRAYIIILALLLLTGGAGYQLGARQASITFSPDKRVVVNTTTPASLNVNFSLFWDVWQRLYQSYVDRADLNAQKLVYGAISGMVNAVGDPYTLFLPPTDNQSFKSDLSGQFDGIGAELGMKNGNVMVVAPLKGNPAEKAGVRAGDYILKVDSIETAGWTIAQTVDKIRGPKGTTVKLELLHVSDTKPYDVAIVRDTITVPSVDSWIKPVNQILEIQGVPEYPSFSSKPGKIAYIRLSEFGDNTNNDWTTAVSQISSAYASDPSIKGLVFDLRNNPGGYLESAVFVGSEFLKSGTVVSQVNSDGSREDYPVEHAGKLLTIPLVVLVNKGSASAAEIVSGSLQDHKRGQLVGEVTFGKGSVQTPEDLPDGSGLHITTGKWLLPNGEWINKIGITPDVLVPMDNLSATADTQLAKAVELLLK